MPKKSSPSEPAETIDEIWADDVLHRRADAEFIVDFLQKRVQERQTANLPSSYVLNLNAPWGEGKTFFLDRFARTVTTQGGAVAYVNAWQDDHGDDPLLSVIAGIDRAMGTKSTEPKTKRAVKELSAVAGRVVAAGAKGFLKQTATRFLGDAAEKIIDMAGEAAKSAGEETSKRMDELWDKEAEKLVSKFEEQKDTIEKFKKGLVSLVKTLSEENKAPLFVLIDELDRCKPSYAVALLERVKHLFDVNGVVFIIATDTDQLRHTVGKVYGAGFDGKRYLGRFFDTVYTFDNLPTRDFVAQLSKSQPHEKGKLVAPVDDVYSFFASAADRFGLTLREVKQAYELIAVISTIWTNALPLQACVLFPLVIGQVLGLELRLDTSFIEELEKRVRRTGDWKVHYRADAYEQRPAYDVEGSAFFMTFIRLIDVSPVKLYEMQSRQEPEGWVVQQLIREGGTSNNKDAFLVRMYPRLIKTAGRLQTPN